MNVNKVLVKDYENIANCEPCKNEPKTNPTCSELVEPVSESKKYRSPHLCCGIYKEKMIFYNRLIRKYHFERIKQWIRKKLKK